MKSRRFPSAVFVALCLAFSSSGLWSAESKPVAGVVLPKLVDLGADKCIPCKLMAPVLDELKREYSGQLEITFIDVWKNRNEGPRYGVQVIPTQIFYDVSGKERFRHEGFMPKKDILAKWKELGVKLTPPASAESKR